jgi:hypothetical protein
MTGEYAKMFEIEQTSSNKNFTQNSYKPGNCRCGDMVCFSLTDGALPCRPDQNKMLLFNTEGKLVSVPISHDGPVSSKKPKC